MLAKYNSKKRQVTLLLKMFNLFIKLQKAGTDNSLTVAKDDPIKICKPIDTTSALETSRTHLAHK